MDDVYKEKNIKDFKSIDVKFEIKLGKGEKFYFIEKREFLKLDVRLLVKVIDGEE